MNDEFSVPRNTNGIIAEQSSRPESMDADAIVVFLTEGGIGSGAIAAVDASTGGFLSRLVVAGTNACHCLRPLAYGLGSWWWLVWANEKIWMLARSSALLRQPLAISRVGCECVW